MDTEEKRWHYHRKVPVDHFVQELTEAPLDVGVFYYRHPAKEKGVISGFMQKDPMHVSGDGKQTLWELIAKHPKAKHRLEEARIKHERKPDAVLPAGEGYVLTHAANLNRGATFTSPAAQIDDKLLSVFEPLTHRCRRRCGRYDVKCRSVEALIEGKFVVLEFNGAGAEPNRVYDAGRAEGLCASLENALSKCPLQSAAQRHPLLRREGRPCMNVATENDRLLKRLDAEILI